MFYLQKRIVDIVISIVAILFTLPIILLAIFMVWANDRKNPFYLAPRVGKGFKIFRMVKIRSMVINAELTGVDSTAMNDSRITPVGRFIRKFKIDELTQFWNVLKGDMSLVGPRPNVKRDTDLYTTQEQALLMVKPGITDIASIVFADEGSILSEKSDPDIAYNQLIRPGKSKLGIYYLSLNSIRDDFYIMFLTIATMASRSKGLALTSKFLARKAAPHDLVVLSLRSNQLEPSPPPGSKSIVQSRSLKNSE